VVQLIGIIPFLKVMKRPLLSKLHLIQQKMGLFEQPKQTPLTSHEKDRLKVISILAFFSILFWITYNQGGSSMTLFALGYTDRNLLGFEIPPAWLFSAEPLYLVLLVIPLTSLYVYLHKRKKDPTPPMKSAFGLIAMALCFGIMVLAARSIPPQAHNGSVNPLYLLGAYAFMAIGELLITPIGLSLVTHLSPHRYTAMLVGVWYLCIGIGFYLGGVLAGFMSVLHSLSEFFSIYVVLTVIPAIILISLSRKLNEMRHINSL
jgi:POT family proton-dependent oligopeptide transporter